MINMITMKLFIEITAVIYDLIPRLWPDISAIGSASKDNLPPDLSLTRRWENCLGTMPSNCTQQVLPVPVFILTPVLTKSLAV